MPLTPDVFEKIISQFSQQTSVDFSQHALTAADLNHLVPELLKHPSITTLNLSGLQLGDDGIEPLLQLSHLKKLNLSANTISHAGVLLLKQLPWLEALNLDFNAIEDNGAHQIATYPALQHLSLNGNNITGQDVKIFYQAVHLQSLSLMNNQINFSDIKSLVLCQQLHALYLDNNLIDDDCVILLKKLPLLEILGLSHNRISFKGAEALSTFFKGHELNLSNNAITDQGANALETNVFLKKCLISGCQLTDASVEGLTNNKTLTFLDMSYNQLTNKALSYFSNHSSMRYLDVSRNDFSGEGIAYLAKTSALTTLIANYNRLIDGNISALRSNRNLTEIHLSGNDLSDQSGITLSEIPQLTTLVLDYNAIGDSGTHALAKHPALRHLHINYNLITNLGAQYFLENNHLESLYINYNYISPTIRSQLLQFFSKRTIACSIEQPPKFTIKNLDNIFLYSKGFFCILSKKIDIEFFNGYFSHALNYNSQELLTQPFERFIHPEDRYIIREFSTKQISEDKVVRVLTKNGDYIIINWCFQWQNERLYLTGTDLSAQKKSEKALNEILRDKIDKEKILSQQQRDFIAHLCHEIRNPLSAMLANNDVIFEHVQSFEETIKQLEANLSSQEETSTLNQLKKESKAITDTLTDMKSCGRYAEEILNENLDASKLAEGALQLNQQPVDLTQILNTLAFMVKSKIATKKINLHLQYDTKKNYWVKVDSMRLQQIILNLLNNAIKFTDHGQIILSLTVLEKMTGQSKIVISVKDSGIGLSDSEITHLFKRYSQANLSVGKHYSGTGLGLYIAKQLAILMNGDITIESMPGQGSTS